VCHGFKEARLVMPKNNLLVFRGHAKTLIYPYFMVLDTESVLKPIHDGVKFTKEHILSSFGLALIRSHDSKIIEYISHLGQDSGEVLADAIEKLLHYVNIHPLNVGMTFTLSDQQKHDAITHCTHCKIPFGSQVRKYRHHNHDTGDYLYPLCNACNLKTKSGNLVPCLVHNLAYDICAFIR